MAVALLHVFIAHRLGWGRLMIASAVITCGICLSIVYTRTHYAADALGGLLSAVACWYIVKGIESLRRKT